MFLVPTPRQATDLARSFERMFDEGFERFFGMPAMTDDGTKTPALDLTETDAAYTVKLDMPGVAKDDIKVSIDGRRVAIEAETRHEEEKKEGERVVYRERSMRRFARSFTLPMDVDTETTEAKLDAGVLTMTLPKKQPKSAAKVTVK